MTDEMISVKTLIDWIPAGRLYVSEFGPVKASGKCESSEPSLTPTETTSAEDKWHFRTINRIEEELYTSDNLVVWTTQCELSNRFPIMVLRTHTPVIAACWSSFFLSSKHSVDANRVLEQTETDSGRFQHGVAVFESERLTFVDQAGEQYQSRLPCHVSSAWPLDSVILFERKLVESDSIPLHLVENSRLSPASIPNRLFTLFSLSHPLDEAAPVLLKVPLPSGGFAISFASDTDLRIVTVIPSLKLIVTKHASTGLQSLWIIESAQTEDYAHLYEINGDGRAVVSQRTLHQFTHQLPVTTVPNATIGNLPATPGFPNLSKQFASPSLIGGSFTQMVQSVDRPCLSPFAASLSRLTHDNRRSFANRKINVGSPLCHSGSPAVANPFTPSNLNEHINRLSSIHLSRPVGTSNRWSSMQSLHTKPTPSHSTSAHPLAVLRHPTPLSRLYTPQPTDSTVAGASSLRDPHAVDELIDEPLLPKFCLRLIWTEPTTKRTRVVQRLRWDSTAGIADMEVRNASESTPKTQLPPGHSEPVSVAHTRLPNRRLLNISRPSNPLGDSTLSPLVTHPTSAPRRPDIGLDQNAEEYANSSKQPPTPAAFLALDLLSTPWICFLTSLGEKLTPNTMPTHLACLEMETKSVDDSHALTALPTHNKPLVHLPATSAVYMPHARLIACLQPGTGIVLYMAVQKVCILGVSPPPVLTTYSAIVRSSKYTSRDHLSRKDITNGRDFLYLPFVCRPDSFELNQWSRNTRHARLDNVMSSLSKLLFSQSGQSESPYDLSQNSHLTYSSMSKLQLKTVPVDSKWVMREGTGSSFTLDLANDRLLRVYLPHMASDELVERCLDAILHSLPKELSTQFISQWFTKINSPGPSVNRSTNESGSWFHGSGEWVRFAQFVLDICGLELRESTVAKHEQYQGSTLFNEVDDFSMDHKRPRSCSSSVSDESWNHLLELCDDIMLTEPSMLPTAQKSESLSPQRVKDRPSISVRTNISNVECLLHLPSILFSLHLVYEEAKLNCYLLPQLRRLAQLNLLISRLLNLTAYIEYYSTEWPELVPLVTFLSDWCWPREYNFKYEPAMQRDRAPCLLTWLIQVLSDKRCILESPYFHSSRVNDLAVCIVGMVLSAVYQNFFADTHPQKHQENNIQRAITLWGRYVETNESSSNFGSTTICTDLPSVSQPFIRSFVQALLPNLSSLTSPSTSIPHSPSPHNAAIIFLSLLDQNLAASPSGSVDCPSYISLCNRLRSLPSGLATIMHLWLKRSCMDPPPNCSPEICRLIGRDDLARLAEYNSMDVPTTLPSSFKETDRDDRKTCVTGRKKRTQNNLVFTVAERLNNLVRPLRAPAPSSSANPASTTSRRRHDLLLQLESSPFCQVSFKNDLRLREAYRLLQSTSHIRLPRLSSTENPNVSSQSGESSADQGSRFIEPWLEMHLAAAGIRVWASSVGRGMLGLSSLIGSQVPTQLRIPPICLRGRAISPSSGRRLYIDLARDSLTSTSNPTNTNTAPGVNGGNATANRPGGSDPSTGVIAEMSSVDRRVNMTGPDAGPDCSYASDNPSNSMALAIASALVVNGAAASLKTASLHLNRMMSLRMSSLGFPIPSHAPLPNLSSNATSTTAAMLSTANLTQTPAVLAAKHWPAFHNGVAVGLRISPQASIDATWIMYNCRAAGVSPPQPSSRSATPIEQPTAEQAGLLLGLGLNGHLNKLTPFDIREYLVRVHDLHNMAVLLGLCAGKRGSMDQSILRLLAVHYRPLLPSDPLIQIQVAVPSLCQAAAVFGLGLLYKGSAHRHITNLLLSELGRSLSGVASSGRKHSDPVDRNGNTAPLASNSTGWSGAAGNGGLAGDSSELIALSAGLALGLVLLKRADTPCGLSDLLWAEKLHAYMTGALRTCNSQDILKPNPLNHGKQGCHSPSTFANQRSTSQSTRLNLSSFDASLSDRPARPSRYTEMSHLYDLLMSDECIALDSLPAITTAVSSVHNDNTDMFHTPSESRLRSGGSRRGSSSTSSGLERVHATRPPNEDRRLRTDPYAIPNPGTSSHVRELDCYNVDLSGPGAIMALGMAYFDSSNPTVSGWLIPPSSLVQLDLIRPDLLLFQAIAHTMINWSSIEPTMDWLVANFCPSELLDRFHHLAYTPKRRTSPLFPPNLTSSVEENALPELSSEDDVENRCPIDSVSPSTRAGGRAGAAVTRSNSQSVAHGRVTRTNTRHQQQQQQQLEQQSVTRVANRSTPVDANRRNQMMRNLELWAEHHSTDTTEDVSVEAMGLAYINILVGRVFGLGLRFAGTCHPVAVSVITEVLEILFGSVWWPPKLGPERSNYVNHPVPENTMDFAVGHCILALSMILAGSGNLTLLRLIRQLRTIRLFRCKNKDTIVDVGRCLYTARILAGKVNMSAGRAAAVHQASLTNSSSNAGPISVAAVFGAVLGPSFGEQLIFSSAIGLLFLGGGRLTLSNTPEAAALLSIAFLPIIPRYAGDNNYHLQALRHLYVLATRPRRLCAVDVDTGRVVFSNLWAKYKNKDKFVSSEDTIVIPPDALDDLDWIEINHDSDSHWPTKFFNGTVNWEHLKKALETTGYIFVKHKSPMGEFGLLKPWFDKPSEPHHLSDFRLLRQLQLVIAFLKRFPTSPSVSDADGRSVSGFDGSTTLTASVMRCFMMQKNELSRNLRGCYLTSQWDLDVTSPNALLTFAFWIWFNLPSPNILRSVLCEIGPDPSVAQFCQAVRPHCYPTTPSNGLFWLHTLLYSGDP